MSATRTIVANMVFYLVCAFYGCVITIRLLIQFALRGRHEVLHARRRSTPPACLSDSQLGRHTYVKLKDVTLHCVETGDRTKKPLLLCLHGFPEFWYSWRFQLQELSNDFWVVAVDMRGYGDSDKPSGVGAYAPEKLMGDVEQLIHALGRRSCVLMGHDRGGILAWMFAEKFTQMVDRLIVLNAPHPQALVRLLRTSVRQFIKSWFLFFVQLPYLPELYLSCNDLAFIVDTFRSNTRAGRPTFCDHDVEAYKYTFGAPGALTGPLNHLRHLRSAFVDDANDDDDNARRQRRTSVAAVSVPVLILWGADDSTSLVVHLANASRDFHVERTVECAVHFVKGAGHFIQQDAPDVVNGHIRRFLDDMIRANNEAEDEAAGSRIGLSLKRSGSGVNALVGRVRDRFVSSTALIKLSSKVPPAVLDYVPSVVTQLPVHYWMSSLNRKLLSS